MGAEVRFQANLPRGGRATRNEGVNDQDWA